MKHCEIEIEELRKHYFAINVRIHELDFAINVRIHELVAEITKLDEARKNLEIERCNQPNLVKARDSEIVALTAEIARLKELN